MLKPVFFGKVGSYDDPTLFSAVDRALTVCQADEFLLPKKRVLLKVNLLLRSSPGKAATTHPAVISAVISALKKRGVTNIVLADSPAGISSLPRMREIYRTCGLSDLAAEGVVLNEDLSSHPLSFQTGRLTDVRILSAVANADVVFNLCKFKTHSMMGLTAAVKNCFGTVVGLQKSSLHYRFSDAADFSAMLCELCSCIKPAFSLADAVVAMQGNGPSAGSPRHLGFIAASRDPFLLDRVLCRVVGVPPSAVGTVSESIRMGLAPQETDDIFLCGDRHFFDHPIDDFILPDHLAPHQFQSYIPSLFQRSVHHLMRKIAPYPVIRTSDCVGCGQCAEICPKHIISVQDGKAVLPQASCMRCFCCHEICPERAIDIRRLFLRRKEET